MDSIETAQKLIALESVTSEPNLNVSQWTQSRLEGLGFQVEAMPYRDLHGVEKVALAAKRAAHARARQAPGDRAGGIGYFCHNDVVSVDGWNCPHGGPFDGAVAQNRLWGRGACDMKGSAAAALTALASLSQGGQTEPIYFFVTGDEESGMAGARLLAEQSQFFQEMVARRAVGIVGEPTELQLVHSTKGVCHFQVTSDGVAAHSSTLEGHNANWQMIPFLSYLQDVAKRCETDATLQNATFSPATLSLNVVIENEPASANITVGRATCKLFLRLMPDTRWPELVDEISTTAQEFGLEVSPIHALLPLHTPVDRPLVQVVLNQLGQVEPQAVCYATDGCCLQPLRDLIVLGPGSIEQAHRPDEWIAIDQLQKGVDVYSKLFQHYAYSD